MITTLLGGTISIVNLLFEREKSTLLILTKESSEDMNVMQVIIVYNFPEVFPENVTSLPPGRELEFSIDHVPGTATITVAPCRMSLVKLREMKNQLKELLDKNFVRPSVPGEYEGWLDFLCIDCRQLKKVTIKNKYPLP